MNLHKILFPKKAKMLEGLIVEVASHDQEYLLSGRILMEQPFIPEYAGFTHHKGYDDKIGYLNVYQKDSFSIAEDYGNLSIANYPKNMWNVACPDGQKLWVYIPNMYNAVVFFRSLGMDITFESVMNNTK